MASHPVASVAGDALRVLPFVGKFAVWTAWDYPADAQGPPVRLQPVAVAVGAVLRLRLCHLLPFAVVCLAYLRISYVGPHSITTWSFWQWHPVCDIKRTKA